MSSLIAKFRKINNLIYASPLLKAEFLNYQKLFPISKERIFEYSDSKHGTSVGDANDSSTLQGSLQKRRASDQVQVQVPSSNNIPQSSPSLSDSSNPDVIDLISESKEKSSRSIDGVIDVDASDAEFESEQIEDDDDTDHYMLNLASCIERLVYSMKPKCLLKDNVTRYGSFFFGMNISTHPNSWNTEMFFLRRMELCKYPTNHVLKRFNNEDNLEPDERTISEEEWEAIRLLVFDRLLYEFASYKFRSNCYDHFGP